MSIIRDNIEDLRVIDINTNAITDIKESSLSKVASNVLMEGNLALDSSAVTKSNANITYTGNGSTQSITTGISSVDFTVASNGSGYYHDRAAGDCIVKNDAGTVIESGSCVVNTSKVHIKGRSITSYNIVYDGLRGLNRHIITSETLAEGTYSSFNYNSTGVFLGASDTSINQSGRTYILHQTLYTHIKWGLTNQGKRYLTAYNPVTREVMTMYQGSGIAGHQIPNALGIKLDYLEEKVLTSTGNWDSFSFDKIGHTNKTDSFVLPVIQTIQKSENTYFEVGNGDWDSSNSNGNTYIVYGFANSETKIITQYQGTGAAGNFVETKDVNGVAKKPRRVIAKATSNTSNWYVFDSKRGDDSYIKLDTSDAEGVSDLMDISINGFSPKHAYSVNLSSEQYIAIVEFDTTNSTDDTYFDYPTDDTNLNVTAGKLPYTDGRDTTNGAYNVFTQSYTGSVDFSTCPDGIHYVALDSNNAPKFYKEPKVGIDGFNVWFDKDSGKWYEPYNLVTNGDFDTDVSGWNAHNAILSQLNGTLVVSDNGGYTQAYQNITTVIGKKYVVRYDVIEIDNFSQVRISNITDTLDAYGTIFDSGNDSIVGSKSVEIVAESTLTRIGFGSDGANSATYDNISVTPVEYDTSILTELSNPISFIDDKPYQVASGTPMDRLVDYPSIPKNVIESSYVDGDLEVSGNLSGMSGFDLGQTWQDVTASRSSGVTYTNTTGKPIEVVVSVRSSTASDSTMTIDGLAFTITRDDNSGERGAVSVVIPNNSTYKVTVSSSILKWLELR